MIFCIISLCTLSTWEALSSFNRVAALCYAELKQCPIHHLTCRTSFPGCRQARELKNVPPGHPATARASETVKHQGRDPQATVRAGGLGGLSGQGMSANARPTAPAQGNFLDPRVGWAGLWDGRWRAAVLWQVGLFCMNRRIQQNSQRSFSIWSIQPNITVPWIFCH